ncbi:hypothetical protein AGMMS4957_12000 [Bacteroidia bacterium]|nr:hypothetical protein AGMMS4957_12000 [Bacteroidia bacterium]
MRLKNIQLSNYRNFKNYSIDFGTETTIFIGKNGTGKTNLITAIKQSLSFIFSNRKEDIQYDFLASSEQKVESFMITDARYAYEDGQGFPKYPVSIKAKAEETAQIIQWEFYKENASSGIEDSLYRPANQQYWQKYYDNNKIAKELPIFVFFSDSYPHITTTFRGTNMEKMLNSGNPLPRNAAYYKWDEEKNCTEIWVQYYTMQWKNVKWKNQGNEEYLNAVNQKLIDFSESISKEVSFEDIKIEKLDLEPRGRDEVLVVIFENGNRILFDQLPQGYKRIFSIVFDITNRAYMLNSNCDPSGIVFIDEIELHLHPSITQAILTALKTTFPKIQFIVSTHSPLVITNFRQNNENILYKLYSEDGDYKNEKVDDLYGIDYNSGLRDWMDAPYRKVQVDELLKAYNYWKEADNKEKMSNLKNKIKDKVGENSEVYKSLN